MPPAVFKKDFDATIAAEATPTAQATTQTQTASTHKLHTEKHTTFLTVIIADDTLPAASLSPQNPAANSASVRDIIPISRSSPPPPPPTPSAKTMKTAFITAPRRSTYPRPSPPSFLYPEAILPQSAYTYQRKMQHPALPGSNVIGYLPFGLEAVVGLVLLLGLVWAGFRWCVTSPARRWSGKKKERRPLDKPSRYVASPRKHEEVPTIHLHENTNIDPRETGRPEVRRRRRHRSYEPSTQNTPSPAPSSPRNPFLLLPNPSAQRKELKLRTSSEYIAQHTTFFASPAPSPSAYGSAPSSSNSGDYAAMDTADIEALEAGNGHERKKSWVGKVEGMETHQRRKSWVDMGIGKAGDVVSGLVGSLARWTDEDEEGDLLPVAGKRGEDGFVLPVVDRRRQVKVE
jgi:hypothetical protein